MRAISSPALSLRRLTVRSDRPSQMGRLRAGMRFLHRGSASRFLTLVFSTTSTLPKYRLNGIRGCRIFAKTRPQRMPSCKTSLHRGRRYVGTSH